MQRNLRVWYENKPAVRDSRSISYLGGLGTKRIRGGLLSHTQPSLALIPDIIETKCYRSLATIGLSVARALLSDGAPNCQARSRVWSTTRYYLFRDSVDGLGIHPPRLFTHQGAGSHPGCRLLPRPLSACHFFPPSLFPFLLFLPFLHPQRIVRHLQLF